MPSTPNTALNLAAALLILGSVGCAARDWVTGDDAEAVTPSDFVSDTTGQTPQTTSANNAEPGGDSATPTPPPDPAQGPADQASVYAVDAMVGHINGEAVYARQILAPIAPQLAALGRQLDGQAFIDQAGPLIEGRLKETLINDLLLGEADRDLTSNDRQRLDALVQQERDELLRYYGQGSLARAKTMFQQDMGISLDEHLKNYRETLTIRRYMDLQIRPKIVVSVRDIERYYEDHKAQYNRPASRVVRLIIAVDQAAANTIEERLASGVPFETVASDESLNRYNPTIGSMFMGGDALTGDKPTNVDAVNTALMTLAQGEYAGPIQSNDRIWFIELVTLNPEVVTELNDVQLEIRQELLIEQYRFHSDRFRIQVIERGSYTPPDVMMPKLMEIARARFDGGV